MLWHTGLRRIAEAHDGDFRLTANQNLIIASLDPIFAAYRSERRDGERLGDYVIRAGFVAATVNGRDFHKDAGARRR